MSQKLQAWQKRQLFLQKRGADLCGDRKQRAFCLSGDPGLSGPGGGKSAFHLGGSIGVCHAGIFREESDLYAGTVYGRSECGDAQAGTGFMDGDKRIRKSRRFSGKLRAAKKAGAKLVVIKRPGERSEEIAEDQKEENLYAICDEGQIRSLLGKRLGICPKRQLYLVGIGMGNEKNRTVEAEQDLSVGGSFDRCQKNAPIRENRRKGSL